MTILLWFTIDFFWHFLWQSSSGYRCRTSPMQTSRTCKSALEHLQWSLSRPRATRSAVEAESKHQPAVPTVFAAVSVLLWMCIFAELSDWERGNVSLLLIFTQLQFSLHSARRFFCHCEFPPSHSNGITSTWQPSPEMKQMDLPIPRPLLFLLCHQPQVSLHVPVV